MRAFGVLVLVLILSLLSTVRAEESPTTVCPLASEGETALDCPWAAIARGAEPILKANPDPEVAKAKMLAYFGDIRFARR